MTNIKIVTVIGARPQFIKAATVSRALANYSHIEELIVHTGQHYDTNMSQVFFDEMAIPKPRYQLHISSNTHATMTAEMMMQLDDIFVNEKPDFVMVYGDTNSTLAAALVASKLQIKIIHVEAGLRSFNNVMPEEINRIVTDRLSSVLFCPTVTALNNLENEGFSHFACDVKLCGDVMQDSAIYFSQFAQKPDQSLPDKFILTTIHRAENTDDLQTLSNLVEGINNVAARCSVVIPVHPRTEKYLRQYQLSFSKNVVLLPPVGYLQMLWLLEHCEMVMTDSGGLQKEAFFFAKSCITLRNETEWTELVAEGFNVLAGCDTDKILAVAIQYLQQQSTANFSIDLYGRGQAAQRIAKYIASARLQLGSFV